MGKMRPSRVDDAVTDCARCGAREWTHHPLRHRITCDRCGHAVEAQGWFALGGDEDEDVAAAEAWQREQEREARELLAALTFPVLALAGGRERPVLTGWGGEGEGRPPRRVHSVALRQDGVTIETDARDAGRLPPGHALPHAFDSVLWATPPEPALADGASFPAMVLWMDARKRAVAAARDAAARSEQVFVVDGERRRGTMLRGDGGWAAILDHGVLRVTVGSAAVEPDAVTLATVADPAADVDAG